MKIAFFSTKPYDRRFFDPANRTFGHEITYFETRLTRQTDYWIDQGRDPAMERHLLKRITDRGLYVEALPSPLP